MKTKVLILFILFSLLSFLRGQNYTYIPYVEEDKCWSYAFVRQISPINYKADYFIYRLKGDTIINGLSYKKLLYGCSESYVGGLREDNKRIFIKEGQQDKDEQLLYDFNLQEEDWMDYLHQVIKIDTIQIGDTKRKRFIFGPGYEYETWIEGIGALEDFYPLQGRLDGYLSQGINYQKKGAEIVYKTDEWYFNENECEDITSVQTMVINDCEVFPNPVNDVLTISCSNNTISRIEIFNILGKIVYSQPYKDTIDISSFSEGLYLLKVYGTNEQVSAFKIIKK